MANDPEQDELSLVQVGTLAITLVCLANGAIGMRLRYPWPAPPAPDPPPVVAERIEVQTADLAPDSHDDSAQADDPALPPDAPVVDAPPALVPVAAPDAPVAFALPTPGPTKVVEAAHASPARPPDKPAPDARPAVRRLVFGKGEGRQQKPTYPREAALAGEEGTVIVRFVVGEDGHVLSAEAIEPCRWPLLNREAVDTVRDRWTFDHGPIRTFDVAIRFKLQ